MVVWWAAPVEIRGAFTRLIRMGQLTSNQNVGAQVRLQGLRSRRVLQREDEVEADLVGCRDRALGRRMLQCG